MYVGKPLFLEGDLFAYFQHRLANLREAASARVDSANPEASEDELIGQVVRDVAVPALIVDFDHVEKEVIPARVRVTNYRHEAEIDGVRAIRRFPYSGDGRLLSLRPSSWKSVLPYGDVSRNMITIGVEGANDRNWLKDELDKIEALLREHVEFTNRDIEQHNASLAPKISNHVKARRAYLASIAQMKDGI